MTRPTKPDGDKVWINLNGKLVSHPVTTGLNDGVNVQILAGLELGDSVVVGQEVLSRTEAGKTSGGSPFMPSPPGKKKK
jgi:HlyD family secretion protein